MVEVAERRKVTIQWFPGHADIEGNEEANKRAKEAQGEEQEGVQARLKPSKRKV